MAQQQLDNLDSASVFRNKLNSNYNDLYTNKAGLNHASASNAYGVATNAMYGHVKVTPGNGLANNGGTLSMTTATTSAPGAVQLVDNATTNDSTKAATAAALKGVADAAVDTYYGTSTPSGSIGKIGDLYVKIG